MYSQVMTVMAGGQRRAGVSTAVTDVGVGEGDQHELLVRPGDDRRFVARQRVVAPDLGGACSEATPGSGKNRAGGGHRAMRQIARERDRATLYAVNFFMADMSAGMGSFLGTVTLICVGDLGGSVGEHRNGVIQGPSLPGGDHQPLRVAVLSVLAW